MCVCVRERERERERERDLNMVAFTIKFLVELLFSTTILNN